MPENILFLYEDLKRFTFTNEQMAKYFTIDDYDKSIIFRRNKLYNQLGFAIQLCTVRLLGTFLNNPIEVPDEMLRYIANQLNLEKDLITHYISKKNQKSHRAEIKSVYGYHNFSEKNCNRELLNWLVDYIWLTNERHKTISKHLIKKCIDEKIILPGDITLDRFISKAVMKADEKLWDSLSVLPSSYGCTLLESLLQIDEDNYTSKIDRLKRPITSESPKKFLAAINRYKELCLFGSATWDISGIPFNKIQILAKYAVSSKTQSLERMPPKKRLAILAAFAIIYTIRSQDDVIDYMIRYFSNLFSRAVKRTEKSRLRTIKDLDRSARELSKICTVLLNDEISDEMLRKEVFSRISKENLASVINEVNTLTKHAGQNVDFRELFRYYSAIRIFMPNLLQSINFKSSTIGKAVLEKWTFLSEVELKTGKNKFKHAPIDGISPAWKKAVLNKGNISACAYTFWVIENMLTCIKNRDIFLENSEKYNDPRSQLIKAEDWDENAQDIMESSEWPLDSEEAISFLKKELESAYDRVDKNWEQNSYTRIDEAKNKIIIKPLEKIEESPSLKKLKKQIAFLMPNVTLPELLFEINTKTGFLDKFSHISMANSRIRSLDISLCAILVATACNIGFRSVTQIGVDELEYDRLMWVWHNYFFGENIDAANAAIIEYMSKLPLAKIWGTGEVVSADGIRYVVPKKTIHAAPNPKYFGLKRGITCYELINDQFVGLNRTVITGTLRDSLFLLDLVLGQKSDVALKEIMTDTVGYSDMIFGLFALLGYQFSPRIADMGSSRFWRFNPNANYGHINELTKNRLNENLIHRYWDEMLRVSSSLKLGKVNALNLVQMLQHSGRPTMLGRAISEFGKVFKTIHQLIYLDDPDYCRRILIQLNRGESENGLRRAVMYGKKGEVLKSYKEDQEEQMNILALVTNSIVLWNTMYIARSLDFIRDLGEAVENEDIEHISPLGFDHINILGNYNFEIPSEIMSGEFRDLKDVDMDSFFKI